MDKQTTKTTHALALPYNQPPWPLVSIDQEAAIMTLLIPLLQPVGDFRRNHVPRSKGKGRAGKGSIPSDKEQNSAPTSMPEIHDNLTVGFNTTIRRLEALSQARKPYGLSEPQIPHQSEPEPAPAPAPANLLAVLVCRRSFPDIMTSSLPLLIATAASRSSRSRLIEISPQSEAKIAQALSQPRVGVLGIENDAPGAGTLARFVLENIDTVDIPWLEPQSIPVYLPVKIQSTVTTLKTKSSVDARKKKRLETT